MYTTDVLREETSDLVELIYQSLKSLRGKELTFEQDLDCQDILRDCDEIAMEVLRLGVNRPKPVQSGTFTYLKSIFGAEPSGEMLTAPGTAIKAVGRAGWVEGYLIRFGSPDLSTMRDIFTKSTDYGRRRDSDVYVHHRMIPGRYGEAQLHNNAILDFDDLGCFAKHLLDLSDEYERKLYDLVQAGKLRWSSGTAPHLVSRTRNPDGTHTIKKWPLGLDSSYTPSPAGGMATSISAMKSLLGGAVQSDPARADRILRELAALEAAQPRRKMLVPGPTSGSMVEVEI